MTNVPSPHQPATERQKQRVREAIDELGFHCFKSRQLNVTYSPRRTAYILKEMDSIEIWSEGNNSTIWKDTNATGNTDP